MIEIHEDETTVKDTAKFCSLDTMIAQLRRIRAENPNAGPRRVVVTTDGNNTMLNVIGIGEIHSHSDPDVIFTALVV